MEPITHFLTGACLSRSGLNRKTALATTTLVLAAEAPDLDMLTYFKGSVYGFAHHRGITHSFIGIPIMAAVTVGFVYAVYRIMQRISPAPTGADASPGVMHLGPPKTPRWGLLYAYACLAVASHLLLDFTNNYGVRPFEPFYYKWCSWDIVFIFEPLLYVVLLGGLLLPSLFGLINDEIGVRRRQPRGRAGAILALLGMVAVWGVRDFEHRRAVAAMEARLYHDAEPLRVSAYPYPTNPFRWYGVVETEDFFAQMSVDSLTPDVDPQGHMLIRYKPEETPVSLAAKRTFLGRVYLDWAQYPVTEVEASSLGAAPAYLVHFYDLRYMYPERQGTRTLGASLLLDSKLDVVEEWFGLPRQRPDLPMPGQNSGK